MHTRRVEAVRQGLAESRLHGLLVSSLPNIRYLTGFTGSNALLLLLPDRLLLFTDNRYRGQASDEVRNARIIVSSGSLLEVLIKALRHRSKNRFGFESSSLTVSTFNSLKHLGGSIKLVPKDGLVEQTRMV